MPLSRIWIVLLATVAWAGGSGFWPSSVAAATTTGEADAQLTMAAESNPPGAGITTGDVLRYRLTVANGGPDIIPAGGIEISASVPRSDGSGLATIDVVLLNASGFVSSVDCDTGERTVLRCTNSAELGVGSELTLRFSHRHPVALTGNLALQARVSSPGGAISDPEDGNNRRGGPSYSFVTPATTTTARATTTATRVTSTSDSSTTTSDSSTSTSDSSTSTSDSSTTSPSSTLASTVATTSTSAATTVPTTDTTLPVPTSALAGSVSLSPPPSVQAAEGVTDTVAEEELVLSPAAEEPSGGGPPVLLLAALVAIALVLGGVGLGLYLYYNQDPPLVDIRRYEYYD